MSILTGFYAGLLFWSNWNLEFWFCGKGELENPKKNTRSKANHQQNHPTFMAPARNRSRDGIKPGPHGKRQAFSPLLVNRSSSKWWHTVRDAQR